MLRDPRSGLAYTAVWFGADGDLALGATARVAFELAVNEWRGRESLQLLVRHCEPVAG